MREDFCQWSFNRDTCVLKSLISVQRGYYYFLLTRILLLSRVNMVDYKVTVFTSNATTATTFNNVFIKLVGTDGESERKWLIGFRGATAFVKGAVSLNL